MIMIFSLPFGKVGWALSSVVKKIEVLLQKGWYWCSIHH